MVNRFLNLNEVFLNYDRNTFKVWDIKNQCEIRCSLQSSYEPYILKIDEIKNQIGILIDSREQGQELLMLKMNLPEKELKIVLKIPISQKVFDLKFSKQNTILLINLDKVQIYNYVTKKQVRCISFIEGYMDQKIINRFFRDQDENFFVNCKMVTLQNDQQQYLNAVMKKNEQLIRIFSVNPFNSNENYFIQLFVHSNVFDKLEKNIFICNNVKNNTILIYQYIQEERKLNIIGSFNIFQMNSIKYLPEYKVLLNIEIRQQNIALNFVEIKKRREFQIQSNLGFQIEIPSNRNEQFCLQTNSIIYLENPVQQENFTDLHMIKVDKQYRLGYISSSNQMQLFRQLNLVNQPNVYLDLDLIFNQQPKQQLTKQLQIKQSNQYSMRTQQKI